MKDDTRYICPKCGKALKFEEFDRYCQCLCTSPECFQFTMRAIGKTALEAWENWKQINNLTGSP